ncbi:hypothetical protein COCSUDRAFT_57268 [Coccomyxa subellipsoidea C-169]|uniref:Actin-fragmin kinase catalytic domain-containing protein n=1 Tax=Coccomyxa subellipsoidea (strain C-169) TaxID=574566 RepID=I0YQN0_COCSC|nr:hypothetical protein COCSUDRAFT_57268 [Coccomyxa subellipsoidea C-169]EIE20699.1 hypothetical protein COCSUDRAFT_57268 [Coccomyxa subellipsoidea C-169]|eukprot:XP_005645243.1 hypothetical protein COCSUDRAFT_57268 [Coccomyxa subellipsoidea C-169]
MSQQQDGGCLPSPAAHSSGPVAAWRQLQALELSDDEEEISGMLDATPPHSPTAQTSPVRQQLHRPPRSPASAAAARKRLSPKKSPSPPKKGGSWSHVKGRHSRRPPPLILSPRSSAGKQGAARSSSEGEKAVQEWQRAMKSPSPSKWRASNAVRQLEADTIALAAGAVTAMLAANAAAAGPLDSPEKVVRRTWDWLAEQPEDAAELAVLLFEAAPKLKISASGSGGASQPPKASRRSSYKEEGGFQHRLSAGVPCPIGAGEIDWKQLTLVIGSEMLKFETEHAAASEACQSGTDEAQLYTSPRGGGLVEVNSGGHVMFCFLSGPTGHTHRSRSHQRDSQHTHSGSQQDSEKQQQHHDSTSQQHSSQQMRQPGSGRSLVHAFDSAAAGEEGNSMPPSAAPRERPAQDTLSDRPRSPEVSASPSTQPSPGDGGSGRFSPCSSLRGGSRSPSPAGSEHAPERVVIVKVHQARLASQSEQFANELTQHLGICAPACRILRRMGATAEEWKEAHGAAMLLGRRGADLEEQMARSACMLVMEYIPGRALFHLQQPFQPAQILRTAEDLGRLFLLDMLLGNADQLPCATLGWRGNPHNVLFCTAGAHAGRMVAIDSAVQRRPPGGKMWLEDAACNKLAELALNDVGVAGSVLREAVSSSAFAVEAVSNPDVHKAFQQGLLTSLQATLHIKGLLEMMFDVLSGWIDEFIRDMEDVESTTEVPGTPPGTRPTTPPSASPISSVHITNPPTASHLTPGGARWGPSSPRTSISTTQKIRSIGREARVNELISERLDHWKAAMRKRGEELRAAVEEWQTKRASSTGAPRLTTGFLDGTHPIVDAYELKARLISLHLA